MHPVGAKPDHGHLTVIFGSGGTVDANAVNGAKPFRHACAQLLSMLGEAVQAQLV